MAPKPKRRWLRFSMRRMLLTDDGVRHLASLVNLASLEVSAQQMSDQGLAYRGGLTSLESLSVHAQAGGFTDQGLASLEGLKKLRYVRLSPKQTTAEGIRRFEEAVPGVKFQ
jgi:hypothetical protein